MFFICEVEFPRGGGDCAGGPTGRRGIIVGLMGFSVCLGYGGLLFRGGRYIAIVVCSQGGVLGTYLHDFFVC